MTEKIQAHHISFLRLDSSIDLSSFDCGDQDLNNFLRDDALAHQQKKFAQTFCIFHEDKLIGYFSLVADALSLTKQEKRKIIPWGRKRLYKTYPAIKVARMGVMQNAYQKRGIGRIIIEFVIGMAVDLNEKGLAVKFITVDSLLKSIGFYECCGFKKNKEQPDGDTTSMRYQIG